MLDPHPATLFLGTEILQETGRGGVGVGEGAGEMELSPLKCKYT